LHSFFGVIRFDADHFTMKVFFMSVAHDEILKSALLLPEADRILLATEILDSVAEPIPGMSIDDSNFTERLNRRRASMEDSISASELFSRLDELRRK